MIPARRGFALLDLIVLVALTLVAGGVVFATAQENQEAADRIACGRNLRNIALAMRQYAIDDVRSGVFPRAVYGLDTADKPVVGTPYDADGQPGPAPADVTAFLDERSARGEEGQTLLKFVPAANDVTASLYHLLNYDGGNRISFESFICPSTARTALTDWENFNQSRFTNWPGKTALRKHLGYSVQNMYFEPDAIGRGAKWTDSIPSNYALAADMNSGAQAILDLKTDGDAGDMSRYNSLNHGGEGQNVMYADGRVLFVETPLAGIDGDNIYSFRREDDPSAGFVGSAFGRNDNILLPTAAMLGQSADEPNADNADE